MIKSTTRVISLMFAFALTIGVGWAQATSPAKPLSSPNIATTTAAPATVGKIAWIDLSKETKLPALLLAQDIGGLPGVEKVKINMVVYTGGGTAAGTTPDASVQALLTTKGYTIASPHEKAAFEKQFATDMSKRIAQAGKILETPSTLQVMFVKRLPTAKITSLPAGSSTDIAPAAGAPNTSTARSGGGG